MKRLLLRGAIVGNGQIIVKTGGILDAGEEAIDGGIDYVDQNAIEINETIPDANFRNYVRTLLGGDDGSFTKAEIADIKKIDCLNNMADGWREHYQCSNCQQYIEDKAYTKEIKDPRVRQTGDRKQDKFS